MKIPAKSFYISLGTFTFIIIPAMTILSCSNNIPIKNITLTEDNFNEYSNYDAITKTLTIDHQISEISSNALQNHFSDITWITNLVLPNTITNISKNAFKPFQIKILNLSNQDNLKTIGDSAFYSSLLTSLVIPDSVTSIGSSAFYKSPITTLILGNSLKNIGNKSFRDSELTSITIPDSVTSIGDSAFFISQLTTLRLGKDLKTIGDSAFYCSRLTSLIVPDSMTSIGNSAFLSSWLTSLIVPDSMTSMGDLAFFSSPITELTFKGKVASAPKVSEDGRIFYCTSISAIQGSQSWKDWANKIPGNFKPKITFSNINIKII